MKFKYWIIALIGLSYALCGSAQIGVSYAKAKAELDKGNYWGALDLFRNALNDESNTTDLKYHIGECHYYLKHYPIALSYFEEIKDNPKVDDELNFMLGQTYQRLSRLDEALGAYRKFKKIEPKGMEDYYGLREKIRQCEYAKEMMAIPVNVTIQNLGKSINSRFDDYAPSISANGEIMIFTSRKPSASFNEVDQGGDYKYFEDIYISHWNKEKNSWENAELISENINTADHDAVLSLSPNGKSLFVYKNNEKYAGDIFVSNFNEEKQDWEEPQKLPKPINTSYFESSVSITNDGNTLYFVSERPNGLGRGDIYVVEKISEEKWGKPVNLGAPINTPEDEKFVFIHPNGSTLFFASMGHQTMGSYDIFRTERIEGKWSKPVNLGYPINTVNEESTFSMTANNKKLLISAEYDGGIGERDIYEIDLSNFEITESQKLITDNFKNKSHTSVHGKVLNKNSEEKVASVNISFYNAKTEKLVFETTSDSEGNYEVKLPMDEAYRIKVNLKGYENFEKRLNLKSDELSSDQVEFPISLKEKK